jgi:hypothetical protein
LVLIRVVLQSLGRHNYLEAVVFERGFEVPEVFVQQDGEVALFGQFDPILRFGLG